MWLGGKALAYIRSFYEQNSAYVRVAGDVASCLSENNDLRTRVWDVSIPLQCLHVPRSERMAS